MMPANAAAVQCQRLCVQSVEFLGIKNPGCDWNLHDVGLHLDLHELLNLGGRLGRHLDDYLRCHSRRKVPWLVVNTDEVALDLGDVEARHVDVEISKVEGHPVEAALAKRPKAARRRLHLNKLVAVAQALHGAGNFPVLVRRVRQRAAKEVLGRELRHVASLVDSGPPHRRHARCLARVLLVSDARRSYPAIGGSFHLEVVVVDGY
mmetsp:Transcript_13102/g.28873  ORF Transcript_13102/g.28873 Transcript_13102/m.28873 type:complete len:206 (+) Transcript_13102:199-816(+)